MRAEIERLTAEKTRYLSLLRRVIEITRLKDRILVGYTDVAEFLREEEARKG